MTDVEVLRAAVAPLTADPSVAAVLLDFDGTLAPIVDDPAAARPVDGAVELLARLVEGYATVGVLSGRPLDLLAQLLPAGVALIGLYGLEERVAGDRTEHEQAGTWREAVDDVAATLEANLPTGARVERKGVSITVHYREHPDLEPTVRAAASEQAHRSGLVVRDARRSVELHPPIEADKGTALRRLAGSATAVVFVGDDAGDLPAFDALDDLAVDGRATVRAAVRSAEVPPRLLERADVVLDGPTDVRALLEVLAEPLG